MMFKLKTNNTRECLANNQFQGLAKKCIEMLGTLTKHELCDEKQAPNSKNEVFGGST
jgi:aspartyl/asparaginyl beta-hydroxylase (cupin superfamily)